MPPEVSEFSNDLKAAKVLRTARAIASIFGLRLTVLLSGALGYLSSFLTGREQRIARAQIEFAMRHSPDLKHRLKGESATSLARRSFKHVGTCVGELLHFEELLERAPKSMPEHEIRLKYIAHEGSGRWIPPRYARENTPFVAISGHIGNFELLAAFHARCGIKVTVIGREPRYSKLSTFIDELRVNYGVQGVWRHGKAVASVILRAVREARVFAVLLDQDTALDSIYSPFFGAEAASPSAPVEFAVRRRMPVMTSFIVRRGLNSHAVITEIVDYDPDDPQAVRYILSVFHERLEKLILQHPEQWLWWHRRWRRRPEIDYVQDPNKLRSTNDYIQWLEQSP
jgi:lauroyl/myristoyl acyltransferase